MFNDNGRHKDFFSFFVFFRKTFLLDRVFSDSKRPRREKKRIWRPYYIPAACVRRDLSRAKCPWNSSRQIGFWYLLCTYIHRFNVYILEYWWELHENCIICRIVYNRLCSIYYCVLYIVGNFIILQYWRVVIWARVNGLGALGKIALSIFWHKKKKNKYKLQNWVHSTHNIIIRLWHIHECKSIKYVL